MARHWFLNRQHDIFVDRGDSADYDFRTADLTTDATWRDLDLSAVAPAGAKAVILSVMVQDDSTNRIVKFRKKGNTQEYNISSIRTQVADIFQDGCLTVSCDENRVVQYWASNVAFAAIYITVKGWFN